MSRAVRAAVLIIGAEIAVAGLFGVTGALGGIHGTAYAEPLSVCQFEDGNVDGRPCQWTDPDTGRAYFVTSENYR